MKRKTENIHNPSFITYPFPSIPLPRLVRQYTFTCEQDYIDIQEGYCPQYAVEWLDEQNQCHWPEGTPIRHRPEYLVSQPPVCKKVDTSFEQPLFSSVTTTFIHMPIPPSQTQLPSIIMKKNTTMKNTTKSEKNVRFDSFREIIPIFDDSF